MKFPDPNIGYIFGYASKVTGECLMITFLSGLVKIRLKFADIDFVRRETYCGGRISWDVVRWGRCPSGTEGLRVRMKKGIFREHIVIFDDLGAAVGELDRHGIRVGP